MNPEGRFDTRCIHAGQAPDEATGAVITIGALAFCVQVFLAVDRQSHSVSDTLYGVYPFVIPTLLLLDWIASRASERR